MVDKPLLLKFVRAFNIIGALLMLTACGIRAFSFFKESNPFFYMLTFYMIPFSLLLILAELNVNKVLVYIEFLKSLWGKAFFLLFVGLLLFDTDRKWEMAISVALVMFGFFGCIVNCMRDTTDEESSEYEEYSERSEYMKAEKDDPEVGK